MVKRLVLLLVLLALTAAALADSSITKQRSVVQLADGIYVIRHPDAPDTFPQGNTTVIIGDRGVFVVDSCYLPSSAREDIAQIKQWTSKPVIWLLNTHWHNDHVEGNGAYRDAFPQVNIVAHYQTAKQIAGYIPNYPSRFPAIAARYQKMIDTGKDLDGNQIPPTQVTDLKNALAGKATVLKEFQQNVVVAPNVTFDHEFNVDLGNREVQVKHLGRGNTAGDAIAYLPKEKIVVAGDLLDSPVPYLGGGYPVDEIETLKMMALLEANTIVPGHGDVLHDKVLLNDVIDFLQEVTSEVSKQIYIVGSGPRNLDPVRKAVMQSIDVEKWSKKLGGSSQEDREFFESFSLNGLIMAAYASTWGR
jgi:glyoxylase-like metal-dependent hydrolase (beta-lactamase superfamily II)